MKRQEEEERKKREQEEKEVSQRMPSYGVFYPNPCPPSMWGFDMPYYPSPFDHQAVSEQAEDPMDVMQKVNYISESNTYFTKR